MDYNLKHEQEKIHSIVLKTTAKEKDSIFEYDDISMIDPLKVYFKASQMNCIHRVLGYNMVMMNTKFEDKKAIILMFMIPINKDTGYKTMAEQVMQIVEIIEKNFITVDYIRSVEAKEEKHVYITIFKNVI